MAELSWIKIARSKIGTKEIKGKKHNPFIVEMWKKIKRGGIKDDETPWCSAFVGACLEDAGIISTRFESAKSYFDWGVSTKLCYGCVVLISRSSGSGFHVGFLIGKDHAGNYYVIGGNQNDSVNISKFVPSRILGSRWPLSVPNPNIELPVLDGLSLDYSTNEA